jgi:hypothetical protein
MGEMDFSHVITSFVLRTNVFQRLVLPVCSFRFTFHPNLLIYAGNNYMDYKRDYLTLDRNGYSNGRGMCLGSQVSPFLYLDYNFLESCNYCMDYDQDWFGNVAEHKYHLCDNILAPTQPQPG